MNIEKSIIANKKLIKNIFQITIPAVFDLLAQTLIMAFDMMMVASLGPTAISSVGVGTAAMYALIPALIAVATGTTALLSRAFGANNKIEGKKAFAQSFFIAIPLGIFLTVMFLIFSKEIINLVGNAKDMNLKELNDLIERFGDVQLLEIKEELQKMGYACKIAGDKND